MKLDDVTAWVTLGGAVVAAVAGVWNLVLQFRGKQDTFKVGLGEISPEVRQECSLHIVSTSDHEVLLSDWGFIGTDGRFSSILFDIEVGELQPEDVYQIGTNHLKQRGALFQTGYCMRRSPGGAYAISRTQRGPTVSFCPLMPWRKRLLIRLRLWVSPYGYLGWHG